MIVWTRIRAVSVSIKKSMRGWKLIRQGDALGKLGTYSSNGAEERDRNRTVIFAFGHPSFNPKPEAQAGVSGTPCFPNAFASGFGLNYGSISAVFLSIGMKPATRGVRNLALLRGFQRPAGAGHTFPSGISLSSSSVRRP